MSIEWYNCCPTCKHLEPAFIYWCLRRYVPKYICFKIINHVAGCYQIEHNKLNFKSPNCMTINIDHKCYELTGFQSCIVDDKQDLLKLLRASDMFSTAQCLSKKKHIIVNIVISHKHDFYKSLLTHRDITNIIIKYYNIRSSIDSEPDNYPEKYTRIDIANRYYPDHVPI